MSGHRGSAHGVEGAVVRGRAETHEHPSAQAESGQGIADALFRLRRYGPDGLPEVLEGRSLVVADAGQVVVDGLGFGLHGSCSSTCTSNEAPGNRQPVSWHPSCRGTGAYSDATRVQQGRSSWTVVGRRTARRAVASTTVTAGALRRAPQPAAVPEADLADQPWAHAGRPACRGSSAPAAGGHAVRRQADHRRGRPPGAGAGRPRQPAVTGWPAGGLTIWLVAAGHRVRAGGAVRRAGAGRLADRLAPLGAVHQRHQRAPDGARRDARPRGLRGQRAAGPARSRAPADHGPHDPDEPALRPGPGHGDHRQLRGRAASSTRPGSSRSWWWPWCRHSWARRISTRRATRSTTRGRRSGASSTTSGRPGASVETAKEVKIFGLSAFLIERYRALADELLSRPTAGWRRAARAGAACSPRSARRATTSPTPTSPGERCSGAFTIGDLTFLVRLVPAPAQSARGPADRLLPGGRTGAVPRRSLLLLRDRAGDRLAARTRGRSRRRSAQGSRSRTWASAIPAPSAGRCAI